MKTMLSLILVSFLFNIANEKSVSANNLKTENIKSVNDSVLVKGENTTEVVDVKDTPVETVKDYPTEKWYDGVSFGGGLGMLGGVNFQLGYRFPYNQSFIKNRLGFRMEYNTMTPIWSYAKRNFLDDKLDSLSDGVKVNGMNLKVDPMLSSKSFGFNFDIYPFGKLWGLGNIRLSTGYYFGSFESGVNGTLKVTKKEKIDGDIYVEPVAGNEPTLNLKASLKDKFTGPYLGTGFDLWLPFGFKFFVDAGVVFGSGLEIDTDVTAKGQVKITGTRAGYTISETKDFSELEELKDIDKKIKKQGDEQIEKITEKIKGYEKLFPMLKLGIIYRF